MMGEYDCRGFGHPVHSSAVEPVAELLQRLN